MPIVRANTNFSLSPCPSFPPFLLASLSLPASLSFSSSPLSFLYLLLLSTSHPLLPSLSLFPIPLALAPSPPPLLPSCNPPSFRTSFRPSVPPTLSLFLHLSLPAPRPTPSRPSVSCSCCPFPLTIFFLSPCPSLPAIYRDIAAVTGVTENSNDSDLSRRSTIAFLSLCLARKICPFPSHGLKTGTFRFAASGV